MRDWLGNDVLLQRLAVARRHDTRHIEISAYHVSLPRWLTLVAEPVSGSIIGAVAFGCIPRIRFLPSLFSGLPATSAF